MLFNLWLLYNFAPATTGIADLLPQERILGLAIASIATNIYLVIRGFMYLEIQILNLLELN